ncbi:recombinase family protein [Pseudomonas syringae]
MKIYQGAVSVQKLAFSYVRFSSLKQRHGDSLKRQTDMVANWLLANPEYKLSGETSYQDLGKSGFSGAHLDNAFGRLLAAIENGAIPKGSAILIEQIDRAGRMEPMEMLPLLSRIVNAGVDLVTLDDGITYDRASVNSNHLFLLVAKVQQAHQYSDSLSRRLRAAYQTKRAKAAAGEGATRRMPLWIRDGKLRDDIAPFVTQVFEDYAAGIGERRILGRLKGQHPDFETISPSTFRRWLRNPVAVGRWNDIEDVWPAVVSKELWFRVQKRLTDGVKPKAASSKYLLSGLVKCARCGKNYCVGGQKGALTMLCVSRHRFGSGAGGCTNKRSIPYAVFDFIRSQTAHAALVRASQSQNLTTSEKRQIEIDGELTELRKQSAHAAEGLVRYGMIKEITDVLDRVTAQIDQLEKERVLLQAVPAPVTMDDMVEVENDMLDDDIVKLNALLQGVGYQMVVDDRTITVHEASVFSDTDLHVFKFLGTDRVLGTYRLSLNGERIEDIPNTESKVWKAGVAAYYEEEARYESGSLVREEFRLNAQTGEMELTNERYVGFTR